MKLPLSNEEKVKLRQHKIKMAEMSERSLEELSAVLKASPGRARILKGLAAFQQVPSIGHHLAEKMVLHLEVYSLEELKGVDAAHLFDRLEVKLGVWTDACVEDQIRCLVHHADYPDSTKLWHDFMEERKVYREHYGYPESRPTIAWYEKREHHADLPNH